MEYNIESLNAKLKLLGYPYVITGEYGMILKTKDIVELNIVEPVRYIPSELFYNNYNIEKVNLPKTLEVIRNKAFTSCGRLTEINIPSNVRNLGALCLARTNIKELVIPDSVKIIEYGIILWCHKLEKVTFKGIPDYIDKSTFDKCAGLKLIEIPKNSRHIYIYIYNKLFRFMHLDGVEIVET